MPDGVFQPRVEKNLVFEVLHHVLHFRGHDALGVQYPGFRTTFADATKARYFRLYCERTPQGVSSKRRNFTLHSRQAPANPCLTICRNDDTMPDGIACRYPRMPLRLNHAR